MDCIPHVDSNNSYGTDTDNDILQELEEGILMVVCNTQQLVQSERVRGRCPTTVNHDVGVMDILN